MLRLIAWAFAAAFQLPLTPTQSYGVGSQFIVSGSCPETNSKLMDAITAYPRAPCILCCLDGSADVRVRLASRTHGIEQGLPSCSTSARSNLVLEAGQVGRCLPRSLPLCVGIQFH